MPDRLMLSRLPNGYRLLTTDYFFLVVPAVATPVVVVAVVAAAVVEAQVVDVGDGAKVAAELVPVAVAPVESYAAEHAADLRGLSEEFARLVRAAVEVVAVARDVAEAFGGVAEVARLVVDVVFAARAVDAAVVERAVYVAL